MSSLSVCLCKRLDGFLHLISSSSESLPRHSWKDLQKTQRRQNWRYLYDRLLWAKFADTKENENKIKIFTVHFFITVNFSSSRLSLIPRIIPFPRWIKVLLVVQLHSQSSCLSTKCKYKVQVHTSKVKSSLSLKQWPAAKKLRQCPLSITDLAQMPRRGPKA